MAPPGRRASMRSVRTLPIVHEDEDVVGVATPESVAAYPVRQKRHSGVVTAMPPLPAGDAGVGGSDEEGDREGATAGGGSENGIRNGAGHSRGRYGGSSGSNSSNGGSIHRHPQQQHRPHYGVLAPGGQPGYGGPNYPYVNPACSESSEESGITDRKLEQMAALPKRSQNQEWFAKRGGWYRLALTLALLAIIAVGLGVGLKFGLQNKSSSASDSPSTTTTNTTTTPQPKQAKQFPAGSYTFTVAFTNVSTGCTSNGFAFGCYPSTVYSPSSSSAAAQNASAATFDWVISGTTSGSTSSPSTITTYSISSSSSSSSSLSSSSKLETTFAPPTFQDVFLTLLDSGLDTERLVFNFTTDLAYVPTEDLVAAQTSSATCYYNQTAFTATLWTRRRATFPSSIVSVADPSNSTSSHDSFSPWPFAVDVAEIQQAGPSIPDCVDFHGRSLGDFSVNGTAGDASADQCGCWYSNAVDTGNGTSTR